MKLFFLLLLPMLALSSMLGDKESDAVEAQTPWGNVRVSIELEKPTTMLGEPTSLVYKIENQTDRELFTTYGLTRNAYGRPQNFEVVAVGENGQEVELLTLGPHQCFGGLLGSHPIPKGKSWSKKLYLPKWFVLKHPGTYSIQCRTPSCIATTNQAALAHDSAVESPKQTKSPRKEIENVTIVDVDLSTVLKVVPADDKKMGQLIESLGQTVLGEGYGYEAQAAMQQLLSINDTRTIPYLVQAVSKPDYSCRFQAIRGLAKFDSDEALAGIEIGLTTTDDDIRGATSKNIRHAAAVALSRSPHPEAEARLLSHLDHPDGGIRSTVVHRLGKLKSDESLQLLKGKTNDSHDSVRREAIRYIKQRLNGDASEGKPTSQTIDFLRELVQDYQTAYDKAKTARGRGSTDTRSNAYHWLESTQGNLAIAEYRFADAVTHFQNAVDEADKNHQRKKKHYDLNHARSGSSEHTTPVTKAHTRLIFARGKLQAAKNKLSNPKQEEISDPNQTSVIGAAKDVVVEVDAASSIQEFAQTLKPKLPKGWTVAINQKTLAIERDQKVQVMPYFGRRPKSPDETEDEYFKDMGSIIKLDIVLRFEPRMSEASWLKLSARRADLLESGKDGFRNKTELSEHSALVDKYQLPSFETRDSSIFQTPLRHYYELYYELRDDQVRQELSEVQAILNKALPANRGMIAIADQPKIRWPTVWVNTEPTASFSINKTTAQPLTADQAVKQFSNDAETGFINPKWGETIDWKDAPDFEAWIEANPRRARLTQKPRNPKPRASIVRLSKRQVEVKVIRTAGLHMGRTHFAVAKHFRIPRTREVDATFGLPALEVEHLTTFKGIGKGDKQDRVLKQLGKPDHSRRLQNGDWYDYYFDDDITLFYHLRHVHSLSFTVPPAVKQQAKESPQADK